jgi:hypothetical protein
MRRPVKNRFCHVIRFSCGQRHDVEVIHVLERLVVPAARVEPHEVHRVLLVEPRNPAVRGLDV